MTRPYDVQEFCRPVVWEARRSPISKVTWDPCFKRPRGTLTSNTLTRKQSRPLRISAQCLPRGYHFVSDGHFATPLALLHREDAICPDTGGCGPIPPQLRWSGAGAVTNWTQMPRLIYKAKSGLGFRRIRCLYEIDYPEWVLYIIERFRHTREPLNSGPFFVRSARLYDHIHFLRAQGH